MKSSLTELNDNLMDRLREVSAADLDDEQMERVIKRAKASVQVAGAIIDNGRLVLDGAKFMANQGIAINRGDFPMLPGAAPRADDDD